MGIFMTFDSFRSRLTAALGVVTLAAAMFAAPVAAEAAGNVAKIGGGTCDTFSTFSYDSTSNTLSINCGTSNVGCNTQGPGSFAITNAGATHGSAAVGTTATFTIQRTGGCQGKYYVIFGLEPSGLTNPHVVAIPAFGDFGALTYVVFEDGDTSKTVGITTGSTTGSLGVFLTKTILFTDTTVKTTLDGTRYVIDVTAGGGNGGGGPLATCAAQFSTPSAAIVTINTADSGKQFGFNLAPGETASFGFVLPATANSYGNSVGFSTFETNLGPGYGAAHEIAFSTCPNDFSYVNAASAQCHWFAPDYTGSNARIATVDGIPGACMMPPGQVYMNIRFKDRNGANTCNNGIGKCQQWNNLVFPAQ